MDDLLKQAKDLLEEKEFKSWVALFDNNTNTTQYFSTLSSEAIALQNLIDILESGLVITVSTTTLQTISIN